MNIQYFKTVKDGYIPYIGTGSGDIEITKEEYDNIYNIISNRPIPEDGYDCILKEDLTWEHYKVETVDEDELEISNDEFMDMIEEVL